MKVTKAQLKKIIAEEYQKLQEGSEVSRMIGDLERIGEELGRVGHMVTDPAVAERLESIDSMVTDLFEKMHSLLSRD